MVSAPFQLEGVDAVARRGAPELGQHTEEVLIEQAGSTWDKLAELREQVVVSA